MAQKRDFHPVDPSIIARFSDLATFLRARRYDLGGDIDIGLCGVPFDLGLNYRSGPRQGPAGVREASRIIRLVHPNTKVKPFELCNVADIGDAPINPLNKDESISRIQSFFEEAKKFGIRPIAIGGDHTIPTPILRALASNLPVGVLHIDAHADTLDSLCGTKINHATFMRRCQEEGLIDSKRVVQIGLRGSRFSEHDIQFGYEVGYKIITFDEYEAMGREQALDVIREVLGDGPIYVSLDIDSIDPAYAPGTAVPEIGGFTTRDVQMMLRALTGKDIIGADISEVAPAYDPSGITCLAAANFMFELLCVMAEGSSRKKGNKGANR